MNYFTIIIEENLMNEKLHPHGLRKKFREGKPNEIIKEVCPDCGGEIIYYPDRIFHRPPCPPEKEGVKMMSDYMEKEIKGVVYRVHNEFVGERYFRELYEKALADRILKIHEQEHAKGQMDNDK